MEKKTRSFNFLLELLICLVFFSVTSLIVVGLFVRAKTLEDDALNQSNATMLYVDTVEQLSLNLVKPSYQGHDMIANVKLIQDDNDLDYLIYQVDIYDDNGQLVITDQVSVLRERE